MLLVAIFALAPTSILIDGGTLVDGTGAPGRRADVRVVGTRVVEIGNLTPKPGETVLDARGRVVAPGFIDAHSHADGRIDKQPMLESQIRQGITTAVVGQDGGRREPVASFFRLVTQARPTLNFAAFSGHGGLRTAVMGSDFKRVATPEEQRKMQDLLRQDMAAGALGLSTGLEYDPGIYSDTAEVIGLARVIAPYRGMVISHVRDEGRGARKAFQEQLTIAQEAKVAVQISHIKLAAASVWHQSEDVLRWMASARAEGLTIGADVYPYLYWQSTITALTVSRDFENLETWREALADVGGPENILLSRYTPDPLWEGQTIAQLVALTGKPAEEVIRTIVRTATPQRGESVVVTAMSPRDLQNWVQSPLVAFCSDGSDGGSHPRGAGSFPRILGRFVREEGWLTLEEAIRKMTSLSADRFGLARRGQVRVGWTADLTIFDPNTILDRATPKDARAMSVGVVHVLVNGQPVLRDAKMTGLRPGVPVPKG